MKKNKTKPSIVSTMLVPAVIRWFEQALVPLSLFPALSPTPTFSLSLFFLFSPSLPLSSRCSCLCFFLPLLFPASRSLVCHSPSVLRGFVGTCCCCSLCFPCSSQFRAFASFFLSFRASTTTGPRDWRLHARWKHILRRWLSAADEQKGGGGMSARG